MPVAPCGLHEDPSHVTVTRACDASALLRLAARVLRGDQAQIRHQCRRRSKTREVSELRGQDDRGDDLYTAQGLKCLDQRTKAPALDQFDDVLSQSLDTRGCVVHRLHTVDEHAIVSLVLEYLTAHPVQVHARPGCLSGVRAPVAKQKLRELMACRALGSLGVVAAAFQVAHRLGRRFGYVDLGEIAAPQKTRKLHRIPTVGLDPISRLLRHERWRDNHALDVRCSKRALQDKPRRSGLVAAPQRRPSTEFLQALEHKRRVVRDRRDILRSVPITIRHRDGDALLVDVQTYESYLLHWTSLPHAALRRLPSSCQRNPRSLRDGWSNHSV